MSQDCHKAGAPHGSRDIAASTLDMDSPFLCVDLHRTFIKRHSHLIDCLKHYLLFMTNLSFNSNSIVRNLAKAVRSIVARIQRDGRRSLIQRAWLICIQLYAELYIMEPLLHVWWAEYARDVMVETGQMRLCA